jgi:hypothetical protein
MPKIGYSISDYDDATGVKSLRRFHIRTAFIAIFIFAALACLNGTTALAQWSGSATGSYGAGLGSIALSQSILSGTRRIGNNAQSSNTTSSGPRRIAYGYGCRRWMVRTPWGPRMRWVC